MSNCQILFLTVMTSKSIRENKIQTQEPMFTTQRGQVIARIANLMLCMFECMGYASLLNLHACLQVLASCNSTVASRMYRINGGLHMARNSLIVLYAIPAMCMFYGSGTIRILCTRCKQESVANNYNSMCDRCGDEGKKLMSSTSSIFTFKYDCTKCRKKYSSSKYSSVCDICGDNDKRDEELRKREEELRKREEELEKGKMMLKQQRDELLREGSGKKQNSKYKRFIC